MIVMFPPEVEEKLRATAAQKGLAPDAYLLSLMQKDWDTQTPSEQANGNGGDDYDPEALKRAVAAIANRTPEQIKAAQEMALKEFQPERELPAGAKNIFDVIPVIRGNETDEQVLQALKELS